MRFEYKEIVEYDRNEFTVYDNRKYRSLGHLLETLGEEGWELVGEVRGRIFLKRELQVTS